MTEVTGSLSSNTWYSLMNVATDSWLQSSNYIGGSAANWQFLDTGLATGGSATGYYLARTECCPAYCLDISGGEVTMSECSSTTAQWRATRHSFTYDTQWLISVTDTDILAIKALDDVNLQLLDSIPSGSDENNVEWAFYSTAQIDDDKWSTLPYVTTTTTSTAVSTTTSSVATTTRSSRASSTSTSSYAYATTKSSTSITSYGGYAASPTGTYFSTAIIDESVADLGPVIAGLLLPPHSNVGCENCTIVGYADVTTGGCDTNSDSLSDLRDCASNGYIDISLAEIEANMALDVQLLPGFTVADTFLSLYNVSLGTKRITDLLTLNFTLDFGVPLKVVLDTPVIFTGGFLLNLPRANIHLELGDVDSKTITGLYSADVTAHPFHVPAPDLQFTAVTGLSLRVHAQIIESSDLIDADGMITLEVTVPRVQLTTSVLSDVNDDCVSSSGGNTHEHALDMNWDVIAGVYAHGDLNVENVWSWESDEFSPWNYTIKTGNECLYDDKLKAGFLTAVAGGGGARGRGVSWSVGIGAALLAGMLIGGI